MAASDILAGELLTALTTGESFEVPSPDLTDVTFQQPGTSGPLNGTIEPLTNDDLTTGAIDGTGIFDGLMRSMAAQLKGEFTNNRITGQEYTKAYIGLVTAALSTATQFVLGRDQAHLQSLLVQQQAQMAEIQKVQARVELEATKVNLAKIQLETLLVEVNFAQAKLELANTSAQYDNLLAQKLGIEAETAARVYQNTNILPQELAQITGQVALLGEQLTLLEAQRIGVEKDNDTKQYSNTNLQPLQKDNLTKQNVIATNQADLLAKQILVADAEKAIKIYTESTLLRSQNDLVQEQRDVQRAQTTEKKVNGNDVEGVIGQQKLLYIQQIDSYKRDAEAKVAKMFVDAWITMKTIDPAYGIPNNLDNNSINEVVSKLRNNLGLT